MSIIIPPITPEDDVLRAALRYAAAGLYVGPVRRGTKDPSSTLGKGWHTRTSTDPHVVASWFPGTDHGVFLHCGRSGLVVLDVDTPDRLPQLIVRALTDCAPPYQTTRAGDPRRGHYLFATPPGRELGNSVGGLGSGWGEIRGRNGLIVVAPTVHMNADSGGLYTWRRSGPVPVLPAYLAEQLPDAMQAAEAATDVQVTAFLDAHTGATRPDLIKVHAQSFQRRVDAGESRHHTMAGHLAGAMKDAAAGYVDARAAADTLQSLFLSALARPPVGKQGASRTGPTAHNEWYGLLSWAVAQATATDPETHHARVAEKVPALGEHLRSSTTAPSVNLPSGGTPTGTATDRRVVLISADTIRPRPVRWLWEGRLALGTLGLLAGREGLGKSTLAYWVAARMTRGELDGCYRGTSKSVLVAATEDSWAHTIVPRLMAAGADLTRVYQVEVLNADDVQVGLSLPRDLLDIERRCRDVDAGLMLLDPLMSRLGDLDTHRDAEVRQALEPLVTIADRTRMAVLGLMHHNKSGSVDPMHLVMGSRAFTAVARSVHTVVPDPDDDNVRLFGTPKNNLGTTNLPTLAFTLASCPIETDEGTAWTAQLIWGEERTETIREAMSRTVDDNDRSATDEAADWLYDYIVSKEGQAPSADVKRAAKIAGHTEKALRRARHKLGIEISSGGFPRATHWSLPAPGPAPVVPAVAPPLPGEVKEGTTDSQGSQLFRSEPVAPVVPAHGDGAPEGPTACDTCSAPLLLQQPGRTTCGRCVQDRKEAS
ncbi:AAA family ATPase [Ornithinimicrobium pekingense]|uniref:DNA primase/polymerase bifunctional N-terminal domain-containing protein n=1 Tax=Ornithinimicrobium pekingense TaxID=384677 RepID=A0ABQ2F6X9_9MICO|nr:AAA family ATPase [Ornithinimicrobium pekingense]GGK64064.1 hypothetical protein GCM10011509_10600 [Ornithinimicrobium pekingense]